MKLRGFLIDFTVITLISFVGCIILFYGAHNSEISGKSNVYLIIGKVLMWPWFILEMIQEWLFPEKNRPDIYSAMMFQYGVYFFVCYLLRKVWGRISRKTKY